MFKLSHVVKGIPGHTLIGFGALTLGGGLGGKIVCSHGMPARKGL
jgi:hypothetical protein